MSAPAAESAALLAELAASVIKCSHDARGALATALLLADHLARHPDPKVRDAAATIATAIERAAAAAEPAVTLARPHVGPTNSQAAVRN